MAAAHVDFFRVRGARPLTEQTIIGMMGGLPILNVVLTLKSRMLAAAAAAGDLAAGVDNGDGLAGPGRVAVGVAAAQLNRIVPCSNRAGNGDLLGTGSGARTIGPARQVTSS